MDEQFKKIEYTVETATKIIKELNRVIDEYGNTGYACKMLNELLTLAYTEGVNYQRQCTIHDLNLFKRTLPEPRILQKIKE